MPEEPIYTKSEMPLNTPPLLYCICVSAPPGLPAPAPPVPKHVPFTETHPPLKAMPPANVDVEVLVTTRLVTVVVPKLAVPVELMLPPKVMLLNVPPFTVGLFIVVFVS